MNREEEPADLPVCSECGAVATPASLDTCWLCGAAIPAEISVNAASVDAASVDAAYQSPADTDPNAAAFSLASLFLIITLTAVWLGLMVLDVRVGIGATVLMAPAFIRTVILVSKKKTHGQSLEPGEKVLAFLGSLGIMVATVVSIGVAFYATCWVGFFGGMAAGQAAGQTGYDPLGTGMLAGISVGVIGGLVVAVLMIRWLWPVRTKDTTSAETDAAASE